MFIKSGSGLRLVKPYLFDYLIPKRYINPNTHWSKLAKLKTSTTKALEYFDDLYGEVYGKDWPSMRVALLTQSKYVALVNNYSDVDRIVSQLENLGAMEVRQVLEYETKRLEDRSEKGKRKGIPKANKVKAPSVQGAEDKLRNLFSEKSGETDDATQPAPDDSSRLIDSTVGGDMSALYEFVPATKLKGKEDWIEESDHFRYYNAAGNIMGDSEAPVMVEEQRSLRFPSELKVFSFVTGSPDVFPPAKRSKLLQVTDYYLMDGSSLLPVLALDLSPGDNFLDLCAAPGGKSLAVLQTLYPNIVCMNDVSISRSNRMQKVINEFVLDCKRRIDEGKLRFSCLDGRNIEDNNVYNKILVDVPCTTDRHSVTEDDNNIFRKDRLRERIKIPELQSSLLFSALNLVKRGGNVVYSTCTLSPVQNEGVVHMALGRLHEITSKRFAIVDMTKALEPTQVMFRYRSNVMKFGHQIVPYLPDNYGPMYFCKFVRLK